MEKKNRPRKISEEFKLSVIRDYYSSGMSKNACRVKYGLTSPSMLNSWLKKYSDVLKPLSLPSETSEDDDSMANRGKEDYKEKPRQRRLQGRERAIEEARQGVGESIGLLAFGNRGS